MINDLIVILRWSLIFICSFYGYLKLAKIKIKLINLIDLIVVVILTIGLYYVTKQIRLLRPIGLLVLLCSYNWGRYRKSIFNTVNISTLSCGISIIAYAFAIIISIPFCFLIFLCKPSELVVNIVTVLIICVFQLILIFLIYRTKRFKSGISVQNNDGNLELLLLISILSIFLMTLFLTDNVDDSPFTIILICFIFCGLGLIVWWRKHITYNYQRQLYKRNGLIYEQRIEEYEKERVELLNQNDALAKIIHRDNKLLPAMVYAVNNLIKNSENIEDLQPLLTQLENLSAERQTIISNYQSNTDTLPKTNVIALDAVLHYLYNKAQQNNVKFEISLNNDCLPILLSKITDMTELITLICDLGENAIIAAKEQPTGNILLNFGLTEEAIPNLRIYDNGRHFDKKVIAIMGRRRITTHKEDGGNGIGLMTLFEILNKYNASYSLNEQLINSEFTKYIEVTFDGLHNKTFLLNN